MKMKGKGDYMVSLHCVKESCASGLQVVRRRAFQ